MNTAKWFDRKFDFSDALNQFQALYERLENTPVILHDILKGIPDSVFNEKPGGKWSVKEHIGHLAILEKLWYTRIGEIQDGKPTLSPADLENTATFEADFNSYDISEVMQAFTGERHKTLSLLKSLQPGEMQKTSLHPRLQQPMSIAGAAYFAAEHDDHHLAYIRDIIKL